MLDEAKREQTPMNDSGTNAGADTPLTQPGSRPVRYELVSPYGWVMATCDTAEQCAKAATAMWPGMEQDPDRTGRGWDIQVAAFPGQDEFELVEA